MDNFKDFKFTEWWSDNWNLYYIGLGKDIVIQQELIAQAGKPVGIRFSTDSPESDKSAIETISFPNNVKSVHFGTSYADKDLIAIHVAEDSPFLKSVDGVLFSKDGKTLIKAPAKMQGSYDVPNGVEVIGRQAFEHSALERIKLPETVNTIDYGAFSKCENLAFVNLPDSVRVIRGNAFEHCKKLRAIAIPSGINILRHNRSGGDDNSTMSFDAFYGCTGIENFEFKGDIQPEPDIDFKGLIDEFEEQLTGEAWKAVSPVYLLECIKLVPQLGKYLQRLIVAAKRGEQTQILEHLMGLKEKTKTPAKKGKLTVTELSENEVEIKKHSGNEEKIEIPSTIDGKRVTAIGLSAFKGNEYINHLVIPEGVAKIGRGAFANCISLEEVKLPESCIEIEDSAFSGCKSLRKINLPKGLKKLSSKVLYGCVSLENLELPAILEHIEESALENCEKLDKLELPEGLLSLGKESLNGCGFNHGPKLDTTWGYTLNEFVIPASVTKIDSRGDGLFAMYPKAEELFGVFEYKVKLVVAKNSAAHKFAAKNKIKFRLV